MSDAVGGKENDPKKKTFICERSKKKYKDKMISDYTNKKTKQTGKKKEDALLGWNICDVNVITGGELGKSSGNSSIDLKNPPSYMESGGPTTRTFHLKMFSPSMPTEKDSLGFFDSSASCFIRSVAPQFIFDAIVFNILDV